MNLTGRTPRILRVDGAAELVGKEVAEYCTAQHIILQIVVGYNHTMQCRVEAAISHVKQHVRISLTTTSAPTRWWPHTTTDFAYKKNYLWHSLDTWHDPQRYIL